MSQAARLRLTGLLLALCLNAAFVAMFVWQARPGLEHVPDPARMAVVWAVVTPPAPAPAPRAASTPRPAVARAPSSTTTITAPAEATLQVHDEEAIVESDAADPFDQPPSATSTSLDKAVMGKAIKTAMAERQALEDTQKFVKSGPAKTQYEVFADNVDEATIPYCYRPNAMKHTPPVLEVGKLRIPLGGVLAAPFFVKAVASGKCRMK